MTESRPRVLHVLACDDWGGVEVQIATQVLRWGDAPGTQAVAFLQPPGPISALLREGSGRASTLAGRAGVLGAVIRLSRLLRRERVEVVAAYGLKAGIVTRAAAFLGGRPAVVIGVRSRHFSQGEPGELRTKGVIALERMLVGAVAAYDANSCGGRDFLVAAGFPRDRFSVIPNAVDLPERRADPQRMHAPRIVCVARLVALKQHDVLLKSLAELVSDGSDLRCELVGAGPEELRLRELVGSLGLAGRVEFLGRLGQGEILDRLADADLFVLTSSYEGMPGSVLEAMAAGLPVVATDVNGTREVVEDGVTGLLVPSGDAGALAAALRRLLADPGLRARMGTAGRARVADRFSFAQLIASKGQLYEQVAARSRVFDAAG